MTKQEVGSLVLKFMGVYILLRYIPYVPYIWELVHAMQGNDSASGANWLMTLVTCVSPIIYLAFCVFLVVKSGTLAGILIPKDGELDIGVDVDRKDVMTIAFCCIGLLIVIGNLPGLFGSVTSVVTDIKGVGKESREPSARTIAQLVANLVQMFAGLALFLGARGLTGVWHTLQNAGLQRSKDRQSTD